MNSECVLLWFIQIPQKTNSNDPLNQEALFWHRILFLQEFLAESCQSRLDVLLPKLQEVTLCLSDLISFSGKVRINILSLWYILVVTELIGKSRWLTVIKLCYFGFQIIILRVPFTTESCWESVADVCLNVHHVFCCSPDVLVLRLAVCWCVVQHCSSSSHSHTEGAQPPPHTGHTSPNQTHACHRYHL